MHLHLPKPLHGWREFAGEVGIIVIGVLIALGAEQLVEDWRWHQRVAVVRQSLMGELGNDRARWEADVIQARCTLRDVEQLDRQAASATHRSATAQGLLRGYFWMHSANWNLATSSQTLDHFPIDEQLAFAALYDGIAHRQVDIQQLSELTNRVESLQSLADDAQGRRELRSTLADVRSKANKLLGDDAYMERHFDAVGVKADRSDFAADYRGATCAF